MEIYTGLTKQNLITSSVIENTVVTASKQQSDLIKTTLQPLVGLLERTSPAFPVAGLGCCGAVLSQYYSVLVENEKPTCDTETDSSLCETYTCKKKISPAEGRNTNKNVFSN